MADNEKPATVEGDGRTFCGQRLSDEQLAGLAKLLGPAIEQVIAKKREQAKRDQAT